ncbi:MAG: choice-of-anchor L domain-containing protein [Pseudomonadota bacterium]
MADSIFGDGVTVVGATFIGDNRSSGIFTADNASDPPEAVPSESGVILSTGRADRYSRPNGDPNQVANQTTNTSGPNDDPDFNALAGARTFDAAFLDVDFIPTGDKITMQFVFASEEYPEFSTSIYNDAVGVWVNGNPATIAVGDGSTSVGNVNQTNNINLYRDNTGDAFNTEMDGFTQTMTLTIDVIPNVTNSIRIGIADVADVNFDSNILIAADSVQSVLIANEDQVRLDPGTSKTIDVLGNDFSQTGATLTITAINGETVSVGTMVTLPNGQEVTLNADGTLTVLADSDVEIADFTYAISDGLGQTDTGFVKVSTIPCFVAGTLIQTPRGQVPVELLRHGDLITTQDNGTQMLRWIGMRRVRAFGDMAPVKIAAGTFGDHRTLRVSPQHRILVRDALSSLLFGEDEVLVPAKHLVNGRTITQVEGGWVEYVHLLFDAHQVVISEGLATESFLPGPQTTGVFEPDVLAEICAIFPELDPDTGEGYSPAARRTLREYEAKVLMSAAKAA